MSDFKMPSLLREVPSYTSNGCGMVVRPDYAAIYRRAFPRHFPHSPYERRAELADLWPNEQEEFKRIVDAAQTTDGATE